MHKQFVNEFYALFKNNDLNMYIGSREQVRLTLQIKLNRFIPLKYIDRAFKNFIACNLIINTGQTKEISKQIGLKFFKNTAQMIYIRNTKLSDIDDLIKSLYVVFQDFEDATSEVVKKSDIKRLRQLEENKKIKIISLLKVKTYNYNMDFSDVGLLYGVPRSKILEFIAILENYDPVLIKKEIDKKKKEKEEKEEDHMYKWELILTKCMNLTKRTFELDGILNVSLKVSSAYTHYEKLKIGSFLANSIDFSENRLIIKNIDFCMEFEVQSLDVDSKLSVITVGTGSANIEIQISSKLQDDLYILDCFMNMQE